MSAATRTIDTIPFSRDLAELILRLLLEQHGNVAVVSRAMDVPTRQIRRWCRRIRRLRRAATGSKAEDYSRSAVDDCRLFAADRSTGRLSAAGSETDAVDEFG